MKIKELIKCLGALPNLNFNDFEVKGISCNSKSIAPGYLFVAIKGNSQDGNKFIEEAISKSAGAVIVGGPAFSVRSQKKIPFISVKDTRKALAHLAADFYDNPSRKLKVVGVTGTNGKTTITYLIEAIAKEAGECPAVIGTINYRFKDEIIPSKKTTPGPLELQSMLARMLAEGVSVVAMEVSSHALDQERTLGIDFHSAVFTNLTQDHLDYHKTLRKYFSAKAKLFRNIGRESIAIINNDDKYSAILKKLTKAKLITYGIKNRSRIRAIEISPDAKGTVFSVLSQKNKIKFTSPLIGIHNVYNLLGAIAWAEASGISTDIIKRTIERFNLIPGRLERINSYRDFSIFVDYAHTEDALKNILTSLRPLAKKRIIVVFGCGGDRDKTKRPKMGRTVTELADFAILTSDNPRSEDPLAIIKDIEKGIRSSNYALIPDRSEAIRESLSLARAGDIILVAGKGHENYQILKDKTLHFDDKEVVQQCLKSKN